MMRGSWSWGHQPINPPHNSKRAVCGRKTSPREMDGLLPPSMFPRGDAGSSSSSSAAAKSGSIPEQQDSSARAKPQTPPRNRNRSHQVKALPPQDGDQATVEIVWCGDPEAILAVSVNGLLEVLAFARVHVCVYCCCFCCCCCCCC